MDHSLIERELLRKQEYQEILTWLGLQLPSLKPIEVSHLLLRYRFNHFEMKGGQDPIFVASSQFAVEQFLKDWAYFKLPNNQANTILDELRERILHAAEVVRTTILPKDERVRRSGRQLYYKDLRFPDLRDLGTIAPTFAVALHIRYGYLTLDNHGLAYPYTGDRTVAVEGFANPFNHYFNTYCSAFPDLERPFGSLGSFFDQKEFKKELVYVNPPYDEMLMDQTVLKVLNMLGKGASNTFIFNLPDWFNFSASKRLEDSPFLVELKRFKKGELLFYNYMTGKEITPCPIFQATLCRH